MMRVLRTDYAGLGKWRVVADALNRIGRILNGLQGEGGISVYDSGGKICIRGSRVTGGSGGTLLPALWDITVTEDPGDPEGEPPVDPSVDISLVVSAKAVKIGGTYITVTGAESPLTLTDDGFVWIGVERDGSGAVVDSGADVPADDEDTEYYALWEIHLTEAGAFDRAASMKLRSSAIHVTTWSS